MTEGSLGKNILLFSIPLMISNLLQVLFNMADIAVVGQFAGSAALGSVGSTATLVTMFTDFLIGLSGGINVLTALYLGAGNKKATTETVHTSLLLSIIIGILLMLLGIGSSREILQILQTKPELLDGAVLYIRIYFLGIPALAVYNFGNAVFSAGGETKRPLYYLSFAGIVNVLLNLFFVIVCKMSVAGVAWASVIAQYISAIWIVRALFKSRETYALRRSSLHIHREKVKDILRIGVPAGAQNAIFQVANLFIQVGVNSFSATMVAGNSAAANADAVVYGVMMSFYTACGTFMGHNYGAGKKERIRKSYLVSLGYSFGVGMLLGILLVIFGKPFLGLFTSDPAVVEAGMHRLVIMGFSYGFSAFMDCTIAASRALGKSLAPTVIVLLGSCAFRIVWVYTVFAHFRTIPSLYLLYIFSWGITAAAEILYFVRIYKRQISAVVL
ncbi:MAG: MATE family efflux transporter [Blautia sp.]|nr:MATE family efflux transporter [Blautia sp.]MDD7729605.1 MATE family efflux transporter [Clostridia bacterium]MDY5664669.1 MATE family efflux transporter [Blautia sp.]